MKNGLRKKMPVRRFPRRNASWSKPDKKGEPEIVGDVSRGESSNGKTFFNGGLEPYFLQT